MTACGALRYASAKRMVRAFPVPIRLPVEAEGGKPNLVAVLPWRLKPAPRTALLDRVGLCSEMAAAASCVRD